MKQYKPPKKTGSLLEQAGEIYNYIPAVRTRDGQEVPSQILHPEPTVEQTRDIIQQPVQRVPIQHVGKEHGGQELRAGLFLAFCANQAGMQGFPPFFGQPVGPFIERRHLVAIQALDLGSGQQFRQRRVQRAVAHALIGAETVLQPLSDLIAGGIAQAEHAKTEATNVDHTGNPLFWSAYREEFIIYFK